MKNNQAIFDEALNAVESGDLPRLVELLDENPKLVSTRDDDVSGPGKRPTLLHRSTCMPSMAPPPNAHDIAQCLIDRGADVNATANLDSGETPLHWAASANVPRVVEVLLDAGAEIDPSGGVIANSTPLFEAIIFGGYDAANVLIERGAAFNLPIAAGAGRLDLVQSFFQSDGTVRSDAGNLPCWQPNQNVDDAIVDAFHFACMAGHLEVAQWLFVKHPPHSSPNVVGATPLDDADDKQHAEVAAWLRSIGAKKASEL